MMKEHWEKVYQTKSATGVSWYTPHLANSLALILKSGIGKEASVIDVGGGASTLVDDLLEKGFSHTTVLDISSKALAVSKARLGKQASEVNWVEGDITQITLSENAHDLWHDRAVFHFLTRTGDRRKYMNAMQHSVKPGGQVVIATFGVNGPPKCSGLDIVRYSPDALQLELGKNFKLLESLSEEHQTPFQTKQEFIYCRFGKT